MKILIFSDTHLTDHFDKRTYLYLHKLFSSVDRIIINGDFWDGQIVSFEKFINSKWKRLFPLLRAKKTVYIYGNHDPKNKADKRVGLFSVKQTEEHTLKTKHYTLKIQHGDKIVPIKNLTPIIPNASKIYEFLEKIAVVILGRKFFAIYRHFNHKLKQYAQHHLNKNEVLVCGHTHAAEFKPQEGYIDHGLLRHGLAQYLLVENGKVKLVEERY